MIYCGIDIGCQFHEILLVDQNKNHLCKSKRIYESAEGHRQFVEFLKKQGDGQKITIAFEATGIYYRNLINSIINAGINTIFYRLNPLAVKRYSESFLKRNTDDKTSAEAISYMAVDRKEEMFPYQQLDNEIECVALEMIELKKTMTAVVNRLHKEVFLTNPEIVLPNNA